MSFLDRIREFTARPNLTSGAVERARHGRQAQTAQVGLMTGVIQTMANHATILAALWRLTKSVTTTERLIAAAVAALATLLFYGESFANHSLSAGFLYTADCWNVWLPQIAKVISLVQHGAFSGIDFSTHGGASEFFIRAGLYPYHPLVLLYSVLARSASLEGLMRFTVTMLAVHSFLGCYFAVRLGTRYLKLRMGAAIFVAVGFSFSQQIVTAIGFCPFFLSTALVPWAIYSGLVHIDRPSIRQALLCSVPIFLTFLGGYSVMAFSSICLSWAFVAIYVFYVGFCSNTLRERLTKLAFGTMPFLVAGIVAAPLYWSMFQYFPLVNASQAVSLFSSAHQLAEQPRTILRLLSAHLPITGPFAEFTISWGIIAVVLTVVFFAGLRNSEELSETEWRLFKVSASAYALMVLAIYGIYSPVSDLLYAVPGVGMMHIYQRYLVAFQFLFMIALAVMLNAVVRRSICLSTKVALFVLAGLLAFCALAVSEESPAAKALHLNDYIIIEILFGLLFTTALLVPGKLFPFLAATFLMFLSPLSRMYDYSNSEGYRYTTQNPRNVFMDPEADSLVLAYFRAHSQKAIIKYVDLQPDIDNYFPRNYPWYVVMNTPLSSYGGYDFIHAQRAAYARRMPFTPLEGRVEFWLMRPDWEWVAQTGAEFVVYQDGFRLNDPHLSEVADLDDPSKVLRLPHNVVIAPLRRLSFPSYFPSIAKGRYVRVQLGGANYLSLAEVRVLGAHGGKTGNLALGRPAVQSSLFSPAGRASNAVDGNTDGNFAAGSVTATNLEPNAWWQVDLGVSTTIDAIEIWNRTDGSQARLSDYWVFVSENPFSPAETPATLQVRPGTVGNHQVSTPDPVAIVRGNKGAEGLPDVSLFDNGYLRVVGPAKGAIANGFQTDGASELALDVSASEPVKVQYLFWPNERLRFYLQGHQVDAPVEDGLQTVSVPAGRQHLEIRYVYWPARLFLLLYSLYTLAVVAAVVIPLRGRRTGGS